MKVTSMPSLYDCLGVDPSATPEVISKAYKRLACKLHPDKGGDTEQFKEISVAYGILSDPDKRREYDLFGCVPNSEERQLFDAVVNLVLNTVASMYETQDLFASVRANLLGNKAMAQNALMQNQKMLAKQERVLSRIVCSSQHNPVAAAVSKGLEGLRNAIVMQEKELHKADRMLELLSAYSDSIFTVATNQERIPL